MRGDEECSQITGMMRSHAAGLIWTRAVSNAKECMWVGTYRRKTSDCTNCSNKYECK